MSKSQGSSNQSSQGTAPGWLTSALQSALGGAQGLPGLEQLFQQFPMLNINPNQYGELANIFNVSNKGPGTYSNANIKEAGQGLDQFIGQNGKPSAATTAGLKEFNDLQAPGIQNAAAAQGLGNSGASLDAIAQGQEQALVPLLQSDQSNSLAASQALGGLGAEQGQLGTSAFNSQMQGLLSALGVEGMPQQNLFNQQMGQSQLAQGFQGGLLGLLGQLFGQKSSGGSSQTGFDLASLFQAING